MFTAYFLVTSFLEFCDVDFGYGDAPLLEGVSFSVACGAFAAIMGGSGSGKTTLLRLISGQIRPQKGKILVEGRNLAEFSQRELYELRRRMGMLFQFGALFSDLSVADNVAFPLREHTRLPESLIADLVKLKLNAVGLLGTENLSVASLSGGMARRVALARTIALDPDVMLFDEPFTGLDPITLGVIAQLISRMSRALHATSIMVTHDIQQSLAIVDQVIFLAHGQVVFSGSPSAMQESDSPWIQQFLTGAAEGPVPYRYAGPNLEASLGLHGARA